MAQIIDLREIRKSNSGKAGAKGRGRGAVYFTKAELSLMMGLYSRQVSAGKWRDYAIDHLQGMAMFSAFRHTQEQPLMSIVKAPGRHGKPATFALMDGQRRVANSQSLGDILNAARKRFGAEG